jgi:S-formylglutathione hydrolase FrmB
LRTIADRRGRALVGLSAGGYGPSCSTLHHLGSYSAVESWSGYFRPTDRSGYCALDLGSAAANRRASAHSFVRTLRRDSRRRPTFFAFYVGSGVASFRAGETSGSTASCSPPVCRTPSRSTRGHTSRRSGTTAPAPG